MLGLAQQQTHHHSNGLTQANGLQCTQQQHQQQKHHIQQPQELQRTAAAQTNGIDLQQQQERWAIDVGACPGGWTSYLADSCGYNVIAIDPAELHPDVAARPGVHHIQARAAESLEQVDKLLHGRQVRCWARGLRRVCFLQQ